jgi:hypothetical protein
MLRHRRTILHHFRLKKLDENIEDFLDQLFVEICGLISVRFVVKAPITQAKISAFLRKYN